MNAPPSPHPTDRTLQSYGLVKLDDASADSVSLHVGSSSACQRRVSELSGDRFMGRLRGAGAHPETPARDPGLAGGPTDPALDPALAATLPPELIDQAQYEVIRELGRGGMGVVYLARNSLMDRLEVLKVLSKDMPERKGTYERFLREIRSAARLGHPNIVAAYSAQQLGLRVTGNSQALTVGEIPF